MNTSVDEMKLLYRAHTPELLWSQVDQVSLLYIK